MKIHSSRIMNAALSSLLFLTTLTGCGANVGPQPTPNPTKSAVAVATSTPTSVATSTPYAQPPRTEQPLRTDAPKVTTDKLSEILGQKRQTNKGNLPVAYLVAELGDYNGDGTADFGLRYRDSANLTTAEILDGRTGQSIFRKSAQSIYDNSGFPREFDKITFRGSDVVRILGIMEEYTRNNPDEYGRKPSVFLGGDVLNMYGIDSVRYSLREKADLTNDGAPELGVEVSFTTFHNYDDRLRLVGYSKQFRVFDGVTGKELFRRTIRTDDLDRPASDTFQREGFRFEDGKIKRTSVYRADVTSQEKEACKSPKHPSASSQFTEAYAFLKENTKEGRFQDSFYKVDETAPQRAYFCSVPG